MNSSVSTSCAVFLLLCLSRLVSSGDDDYDPCKAAGYVNGDIALTYEDVKHLRRTKRAATSLSHRYWKHGIVPYKIDSTFTGEQRSIILQAMKHWETHSCLTFVERSNEEDYIFFHEGRCGCCSYVGRKGNGRQGISIGNNCCKFGIIVHELGHAVGFWHEHARPDRNDHVKIMKKNIKKGEEHNFIMMPSNEVNSLGEDYDFESIMHYAQNTFAVEMMSKTIVPRKNISKDILPKIGQRHKLSKGDIKQINKMYKCPTCGGTLQNSIGTFRSPNHHTSIRKPYSCEWRISANAGEVISLTMKKFELKSDKNSCETDFVEIRDGPGAGSKLLGRYCENNKPPKLITSTGNRLWVEARLKRFSVEKGFIFSYKAVCGGTLEGDKGEIQSPGFPSTYEYNKFCSWKIIVKEGTKVGIKFSSFDVEYSKDCNYDAVTIYDGSSVQAPMLARLCGNTKQKNVISSSNELLVQFESDNSVAGKGFMLNYFSEVDECLNNTAGCDQICRNTLGSFECQCKRGYELHSNGKDCEVACGGELKDRNGNITSPSYPDKYPENKQCVWSIRGPPKHQIKLTFHDFEMERSGGCQYDYLVVKSKKNTTRFCGDNVPEVMLSTSNEMDLEFHSDNSMSLKGFSASYSIDKDECQERNGGCEHECVNLIGGYECKCWSGYKLHEDKHKCIEGTDKVLDAPEGTIVSPNFPQNYDNNLDITWHIRVDPGHRVKLTFMAMDIELKSDCSFDYVEVRDEKSLIHKPLCGVLNEKKKTPIISKSNKMELKFHTDGNEARKGFEAKYETVCGGRLDALATTHVIFSHVYYKDKLYAPATNCEWHLAAKRGYAIKIRFREFQLEDKNECEYDYLKITDGSDDKAPLLGRVCGSNKGREFMSTGDNMWLQFVTDNSEQSKGFVIEYRRVKL